MGESLCYNMCDHSCSRLAVYSSQLWSALQALLMIILVVQQREWTCQGQRMQAKWTCSLLWQWWADFFKARIWGRSLRKGKFFRGKRWILSEGNDLFFFAWALGVGSSMIAMGGHSEPSLCWWVQIQGLADRSGISACRSRHNLTRALFLQVKENRLQVSRVLSRGWGSTTW